MLKENPEDGCGHPSSGKQARSSKRTIGGIEAVPFLMVNVVLTFMAMSSKFFNTLIEQYIYQRFAIDIIGNVTKTAKNPCFHGPAHNSSQTDLVNRVQELTSEKLLYLDLLLYFLGILSCLALGVLSKIINRKLQIAIPMFGFMFKYATTLLVVETNWNLNWLFLGYGVEGICGNITGVLLGVFLYTADISDRKTGRTSAMIILEGIKTLIVSALSIVSGKMVEDNGYELPAILSLATASTGFIVIFFLPNRKPSNKYAQLVDEQPENEDDTASTEESGKRGWKRFLDIYFFPSGTFANPNVKKIFWGCMVALFLIFMYSLAVSRTETLYLMDEPICWDAASMGYFFFVLQAAHACFTIFLGPLCVKYLHGLTMGVIGTISQTGGFLLYAFATTRFQIYFLPVVSIARLVPMGLLRGEMSRLVGHDSQGTMFACIGVMETFSFTIDTQFLYVYNKTVSFYKGTTMLGCALLSAVATVILIYSQVIWKRHYSTRKETLTDGGCINEEAEGTEKEA